MCNTYHQQFLPDPRPHYNMILIGIHTRSTRHGKCGKVGDFVGSRGGPRQFPTGQTTRHQELFTLMRLLSLCHWHLPVFLTKRIYYVLTKPGSFQNSEERDKHKKKKKPFRNRVSISNVIPSCAKCYLSPITFPFCNVLKYSTSCLAAVIPRHWRTQTYIDIATFFFLFSAITVCIVAAPRLELK